MNICSENIILFCGIQVLLGWIRLWSYNWLVFYFTKSFKSWNWAAERIFRMIVICYHLISHHLSFVYWLLIGQNMEMLASDWLNVYIHVPKDVSASVCSPSCRPSNICFWICWNLTDSSFLAAQLKTNKT